jgi:predicted esterase
LLLVPRTVAADRPAPLLVMLHGAGSSAARAMPLVADAAEAHGVVVLAPDSRGATWDVIRDDYGEDVAFLDRALAEAFRACPIDPARLAIAGFSDGASYALSLGILNGALFRDIIAFSPGFVLPARPDHAPSIFISHGREDPVLPIGGCGRRIAVRLRALGHAVAYREFAGGHVAPPDMVEAAFRGFLA